MKARAWFVFGRVCPCSRHCFHSKSRNACSLNSDTPSLGSRMFVLLCVGILVAYTAYGAELERSPEHWIVRSWHGSLYHHGSIYNLPLPASGSLMRQASHTDSGEATQDYDLSGEWEVLEIEEQRTYRATLDRHGKGSYTWQGGHYTTTSFHDGRWQGTWKQTGNDREGGFELVLSEDGTQAKGIWWYTRVGSRNNIPPRQHGGSYVWKRVTAAVAPRQ